MNIVSLNDQDLGGLSYNLCSAINELTDHRATNMTLRNTWLSYSSMVLGKRQAIKQLRALIDNTDVIHLNESPVLLSHLGIDPKTCQDKTIIYHIHGNRFRNHRINYLNYLKEHFPEALMLASTPDLLSLAPEASWFPSIVPVEKYHQEYVLGESTPPIIYNSATKPRKSVPFMKRVVNNLKAQGVEVEMQAITKVPHQTNLNLKSKADIYFDGLRIFYGVNAIEAASFEMPVVCGVFQPCKEHLEMLGVKCGFKSYTGAEQEEMRSEVKRLVLDRAYRKKVGKDCFEYASEVHSSEAGVKRFMELIE